MPPRTAAGQKLHLALIGLSSGVGPVGLVPRSASSALCSLQMGREDHQVLTSRPLRPTWSVTNQQSMAETEQAILKLDWVAAVWAWVRGRGGAARSAAAARADLAQRNAPRSSIGTAPAAGRPAPEVGNVVVATAAESSMTQPTTRSTIRETETEDKSNTKRQRGCWQAGQICT